MEEGDSSDVDPLRHFGVTVAKQLDTKETSRFSIPGVAHGDAMAAGVVGLVVVRFMRNRDRIEPGGDCLVITEAGSCRHRVKDLDHLGPETAGKLPIATQCVLAGYSALLVRRCAERQVSLAQQSVVGGYAVAGGKHVGEIRPHVAVNHKRSLSANGGARIDGQARVRPDADDHEDNVGESGQLSVWSHPVDLEATGGMYGRLADPCHRSSAQHVNPVVDQLGMDEAAQLGIDCRKDLRKLLDLSDREAPRYEPLSHL